MFPGVVVSASGKENSMRAICRISVVAWIGVLALLCLGGAGCESQKSLVIADLFPADPGYGDLSDAVVMLPPCALPSSEKTDEAPASIVWRAASEPSSPDPLDPVPLVPAPRHNS